MNKLYLFKEWLQMQEGVSYSADAGFVFNWSDAKPDDVISLKLKPYRGRDLVFPNSDLHYTNFYAYQINRSEHSVDLLTKIKLMDDSIEEKDLTIFVNKAVNGFHRQFNIGKFDAIVSIQSSSKILAEVNNQLQEKAGNIPLFSEAFIKNASSEITIDQAGYDKLPPQSKEKIDQSLKLALKSPAGFKMKSVGPQFRKFFQNFLKFNKEEDRVLYNAVNGKRVIVVDDYKTSGATLHEMLRQLSEFGAAEVVVFVLVKLGK